MSVDSAVAPPPLASGAGEFLEVRVKFLHAVVRLNLPPADVVPTQLLTRTFLAPRREFLALGPAAFRAVLAHMGVAVEVPASFIDSLAGKIRGVSQSIAGDPGLAAAPVLTLRFNEVSETMSAAVAEAAEARRRARRAANGYVEELEEVTMVSCDECIICLEEFRSVDDEKIVRTPCSHVYHKACIRRWLRTSHRCPLCRYSMPFSNQTTI